MGDEDSSRSAVMRKTFAERGEVTFEVSVRGIADLIYS
jgi:hypothetical protein